MSAFLSRSDGTEFEDGGSNTAPSSGQPPASLPGKNNIRIFTCVDRHCRGQGGQALIEALRHEITAIAGETLMDVKPCACLDECKKGPVVVAFQGKAAQSPRPPHGMGKLLYRPLARFFHVTAADARRVVDALKRK